jgi:NAD(P)-dependent dehydrogenase (short-subunit alcohol dehydrogenase family)
MGILDGKAALVTGAGQGVGRGIALALAAEGARVMSAGRTLEKVQDTAAEIGRRGGEGAAVAADVKDEPAIDHAVTATVERFGTVDILVNNAQEVTIAPLAELTRQAMDDSWRSGPLATFSFMQACYPHLRGGGVIVNLATGMGLRADSQLYAAYVAAKEAIRAMTRTAAMEWGPEGIRANVIIPLAASEGFARWGERYPERYERFVDSIPLRRVGRTEEDIGRAAVFLCGPDGDYVTGTTLMVDGGQAYLH